MESIITMEDRPFIICHLLDQRTLQHQKYTYYFDAVYPVLYANGKQGRHGVGICRDDLRETIISPAEFFIIRQLWPGYCATDEQAARQLLSIPQQQELFA